MYSFDHDSFMQAQRNICQALKHVPNNTRGNVDIGNESRVQAERAFGVILHSHLFEASELAEEASVHLFERSLGFNYLFILGK